MELDLEDLKGKSAASSKVLTKFPKKTHFSKLFEDPLFEFEMSKKNFLTKNKRYFLFYPDKFLFFKDKTQCELRGICFYDFDLRVEFLYHPIKNTSQKLNDLVYGFKFIRKFDNIKITTENKEIIQKLMTYFRTRLNLANFHDNYTAIKKIGCGAICNVYLADNKETGAQYAVKAIAKVIAFKEKKNKESLINEIKIMRQLNHINLVKLFEVHETDNCIYIMLELFQGGNLRNYLNLHENLEENEVAVIMRGILRGISYLHDHNILHRDLKPDNILLRNTEKNYEEDVCIGDFSFSTTANEEWLFFRCGTPGFVAPEILNVKDKTVKYDKICDLFSVGLIFHILLCGKSIFPGEKYEDILAENQACNFNFQDMIYQKISKSAKNLLMALLEVDPEKRISAEEALNHPFLSENPELNPNEENYTVNALEGQTLKLYESTKISGSPLQKYTNFSHEEGGGLIERGPILNLSENNPENYSPELKKNLEKRNDQNHFKPSNFYTGPYENEERKNNDNL